MKVRIVCYEDVHQWILGKFALKMRDNLVQMGIDACIVKTPDKNADINHHIVYYNFSGIRSSIDSLMITHIDDISKKNLLRKIIDQASIGICMSNQTMVKLSNLGIPRDKLCFINPAHDGLIKPRKLIIGITCRVQPDGRKREFFLDKLAKDISPSLFSFRIMGDGWDQQVHTLKSKGFEVEYTDNFNLEQYNRLIPSLDYYLYMGHDEGQMGFIDALAAGVETIVTPQGYHLDAFGGITYPFDSYDELLSVFRTIAENKNKLINSVSTWNWLDYTRKHVQVWEYLLGNNLPLNKPDIVNNNWNDGIYSIDKFSTENNIRISRISKYTELSNLIKGKFIHYYYLRKNNILGKKSI